MAEKELKVIEEKQESTGECCVPDCGPTTCEPRGRRDQGG